MLSVVTLVRTQGGIVMLTRREFVKKVAYVTPVILTMKVEPSYAGVGSPGPERCHHRRRGKGHGWTKKHARHPGKGKGRPGFVRRFFQFMSG